MLYLSLSPKKYSLSRSANHNSAPIADRANRLPDLAALNWITDVKLYWLAN
ncbi:hypothetical protein Nepgr_004958 [Nepenthes gracilis]|uniref:Uncharacterized protein n=1 Tax=Nepenthes gracilis TaxID=150966 RepID=A0AAD3XFR4_NEPGR|nr:hypothetical protein Nepgr_004958 [Nepenthes gracilis]